MKRVSPLTSCPILRLTASTVKNIVVCDKYNLISNICQGDFPKRAKNNGECSGRWINLLYK